MALKNLIYTLTGKSGGATTKNLFGKFDSSGTISQISAAGDLADGVLNTSVSAAGEAVGLETGRVILSAGEAISAGNRVSPGADGKAYVSANGIFKAVEAAASGADFSAILCQGGPFVAEIDIAANASTGVQEAWQNPTGQTIIVTSVYLHTTTKSTGAATLDIGTTATNATTSSDNLLDGVDVGTAVGIFEPSEDGGTNGRKRQTLAAGKWITVDHKADTTGLVGKLYVEYLLTV